jgi:hypothetical protein
VTAASSAGIVGGKAFGSNQLVERLAVDKLHGEKMDALTLLDGI